MLLFQFMANFATQWLVEKLRSRQVHFLLRANEAETDDANEANGPMI
jgi:hypothetical protein